MDMEEALSRRSVRKPNSSNSNNNKRSLVDSLLLLLQRLQSTEGMMPKLE